MDKFVEQAREIFNIEIEGLQVLKESLNGDFSELVKECIETLDAGGKLILTGVGKSGYIGQKIAATLSSVGSPAVFMHPVEALHGDLGMIQSHDLLIALSYSGETDELLAIISPAKRLGMKVISISGYPDSRLSNLCDLSVVMNIPREACPFNLAPTTSTTALLALGDALAMVLLKERGFTKENFGSLHPGGAIGRAVTTKVCDIMRPLKELAIVTPDVSVKKCLFEMTAHRCGSAIIIDNNNYLIGIFTDGDFRRHAEENIAVMERNISEVMTTNPIHVKSEMLAVEVLKIIEKKKINDIIVLDEDNKVTGLIDVQDLPGLKLL